MSLVLILLKLVHTLFVVLAVAIIYNFVFKKSILKNTSSPARFKAQNNKLMR